MVGPLIVTFSRTNESLSQSVLFEMKDITTPSRNYYRLAIAKLVTKQKGF